MITLQKISSTGKECPICGNNSVFKNDVYNIFGLFYDYTEEQCEMGYKICNYRKRLGVDVLTRSVLIEKSSPEKFSYESISLLKNTDKFNEKN